MHFFNSKIYYERIRQVTHEVLAYSPTNAVGFLSAFFKDWAETPHPGSDLLATYQWLETQLTKGEKRKLWQALLALKPEEIMPWQKEALKPFKESLLLSWAFVSAASLKTLVAVGQEPDYYRLTFIALVRKHLHTHQLSDPFSEGFSAKVLQSASAERKSTYVSSYLSGCASLPIKWIGQLAANEEAALFLYLECSETSFAFEVGKELVERYPQLQERIANHWYTLINAESLTEAQAAFLARELLHLSIRYPAFKRVLDTLHGSEEGHNGGRWGVTAMAVSAFLVAARMRGTMPVTFSFIGAGMGAVCSPWVASMALPAAAAAGIYCYWRRRGSASHEEHPERARDRGRFTR